MASTDVLAIIQSTFPTNAAKLAVKGTAVDPRTAQALETGFITQYTPNSPTWPADCAQAGGYAPTGVAVGSQVSKGVGLTTTGSGLLAKILPALAPIPVVGQIVAGIASVFTGIAGLFGAHHAAAVAREQGTLCTLVPQVNATLAQTDADVAAGNIDVATADQQLEQMVSDFDAGTSAITQDSGNTCNAGCYMRAVVRAEANLHEQRYHNSPIFYLKKYWWVAALALLFVFLRRR
jgi:hypothetical protein